MARTTLALTKQLIPLVGLTSVLLMLIGCGLGIPQAKVITTQATPPPGPTLRWYTPPLHKHKKYTITVTHGQHTAFLTDHHFEVGHWPIECSLRADTGEPPWEATSDYLRCPICGEYVNHSVLQFSSRLVEDELGPSAWKRKPDLLASH